ncbi:TetR/AcrR family transcriptional regulator [Arsenicibacter rosenii]|uniref:HTH tetR-type domain-containing protein n=1 Tax=Arsenicibacter rosenii TaxID=1750698 RepID=A0A1S2VKY2_9BACT|nr:TetR/AcrR family transcriptional regulator [Arsenicibacter rosenii]OIN59427.1 hypothetical protein BLX24_10675 [Arsenicibacter rosenii]
MTTKEKIVESALFLFNRFGIVSVRLQHIADEAQLSVGNLAYHFRTKDDLVEFIYEQIVLQQQQLLTDLRVMPLFVNLERHLQNTWLIQQRYSFFFTDTLEIMRAYPAIKRKHREHIGWQKLQIQLFLDFNISRGALQPPVTPDTVGQLADRYLLITETWMSYQVMQGTPVKELEEGVFKQAIWAILSPCFSAEGREEYEYMRQLPFDSLG